MGGIFDKFKSEGAKIAQRAIAQVKKQRRLAALQEKQQAQQARQASPKEKPADPRREAFKNQLLDAIEQHVTGDRHLRGTRAIDATGDQTIARLQQESQSQQMQIGHVPIPADDEQQHFLLAGAPGTGKSVTLKSMLQTARQRGEKALVYDPAGEFAAQFYRPGIDYILNPLDQRDAGWNPWQDLDRHEFPAFAKAIIPDPTGQADPFWASSAQAVLQALLVTCRDFDRLLYLALVADDAELMDAVRRGGKAGLIGQPKTFSGVRAALAAELDRLTVLENTPAEEALSLRAWLLDDANPAWIFLPAPAAQREALAPLIRVWIDVVARTGLSLTPDKARRCWIIVDELPSLGKIPSLPPLMAQGRKNGLCCVLGIQNTAQVREVYGKDGATSLLALPKTQLVLRVADAETQDEMSKLLGEKQISRKTENVSPMQVGMFMSTQTSLSESIVTERAVLPAEIGALPDLTGYLRVGGEHMVAKVRIPFPDLPPATEPAALPRPHRILPWESEGQVPQSLTVTQGDDDGL
ncbi:type IV secretion system DNA-binding domain-containing protein [Acidithiobacillus sp. CV18-2]|nr:type IV secretion system DNA-binding domain-containing protein [Acidithiobacillus sp. CV18-3]MBU2758350.1 type IV secretion system DNA-binding domain-containing protein [Acidithiobacillus sp. BN09-2]MBU2778225.1 type IV secretion system DNA-binding domain-containing protein [Acidithiobacillus sp. CV18-2]MBU2799098.1 type IV secretion system DNA-binding domain-containing protein [Acidithiobacillus sp. VAN18-4]